MGDTVERLAAAEVVDAAAAPCRQDVVSWTPRASGVSGRRGIARALTARGVKTACGGNWSDIQVAAILRR